MSTVTSSADRKEPFSLVPGGPFYQLLLRTGLIQPDIRYIPRRILVCALVTWLPLVALTFLAGTFVGGVHIPLLADLGAHARFLLAIPILIGAELLVHRRMRGIAEQFTERGLVASEDRPRFEELIAWVMRWRNSAIVEGLILVFSFTGGYWLWRSYTTLEVATWYCSPGEGSVQFTSAGYWYAFISLPIGRFILLRWYFRVVLWYLFMWQVARMQLRLNPVHPDRAGGLGFLETSIAAFTPILIAHSVFLAGVIGSMIWHEGARLPDFQLEIVGFVAFLMLLVLLPLTFFVFQMVEAKLKGAREFGLLAARYTSEFRQKWIEDKRNPEEALLGTADIQSLADLANSFEVVRSMRVLPFDTGLLVRLALIIAIPLLPLTLTMIPLNEILERLVKLLL